MKKIIMLFGLILISLVGISQDLKHVPRVNNSRTTVRINNAIDQINTNVDGLTDTDLRIDSSKAVFNYEDSTATASGITTTGDVVVAGVSSTAMFLELDSLLDPIHAFLYFGDSAISVSYTTDWAHLTNSGYEMFIQTELEGFTVSNDTIIFTHGGDYDFDVSLTHDANQGQTVSARFFNVTKSAGIPAAGANTGRGDDNYMSTQVLGYGEINTGDKIVIQYKGDGNGTSEFKNGVVRISRLHN